MTLLRSRLPVLAAATAAVVVGLTACSGGTDDGYGGAAAAPVDPVAATPQVGTILTANSTAQLGTVVVDGQGFTLYRFDKDSAKPPTSNCADECAQKWPPGARHARHPAHRRGRRAGGGRHDQPPRRRPSS